MLIQKEVLVTMSSTMIFTLRLFGMNQPILDISTNFIMRKQKNFIVYTSVVIIKSVLIKVYEMLRSKRKPLLSN